MGTWGAVAISSTIAKGERAISVSGAEFTPLSGGESGATTMAFSNVNKQAYANDYIYEGIPSNLANANSHTFTYLYSRGFRIVKIPVRWERVGDVINGALNTTEVNRLTKELDMANGVGLKVVIDLHNYGVYFLDGSQTGTPGTTNTGYRRAIGSADVPTAAYSDFWSRMTTQFMNHPAVIGFHIMNEPQGNGGLTRSTWYTASQAAVTAIRAVDTTGKLTIRVGGWNWSDCYNWTSNNPSGPWITDNVGQTWYEAHHYWSEGEDGNYTTYQNALNHAVSLGHAAGSNPDALYTKVLYDLHGFSNWCAQYGKSGVIGENSWPNNGESDAVGDQAKWNALGQAYLVECDRLGMNVDAWSCGEFYSVNSDPLNFYKATSGSTSGVNATYPNAATLEAHL
jgi:endoglucanase